MGGCVSARRGTSGSAHGSSELTGVALGRNQPLRKERPKWKSEFPMTEGQLRSKRDEFWDTAPAFEGRKEIWDALRAAAYAFECSDYDLAQAIADGANISLPHGTLTDCYDELGNRYQLPVYCLVPPVNLITEDDGGAYDDDAAAAVAADGDSAGGREYPLRLRLSTGQDLTLAARTTDMVAHAKRRLCIAEPSLEPTRQRWFFAGRLLADRVALADLKIPRDFVVQVVVTPIQPPAPPPPAPTPVEN
ncbi:ubiquitin domain-containing protein 2-like isoform X1 [Petromyzon marinus]|uniref:Ubiquitin domain-containing protein 2-like n=1 Tax=Petromyzon marinus TaxID=7757 RepID=A0AAJ7SW37_PETMA|nr:ubiquitin domain-containing protein 2-like [Petromyzon marinus]